MRALLPSLIAVVVIIVGCDMRGAKFIAPISGDVGIGPYNGCLWTIPGSALRGDGTMGPQQNLLYFLVVCPDLAANGEGTGTTYGARVNTYDSFWDTSGGRVNVAVEWDRRADKVTIGTNKFVREQGNVFVVRRDRAGKLSVAQLPSIGGDADPGEALRFIQRRLTNDPVIAAIHLLKKD